MKSTAQRIAIVDDPRFDQHRPPGAHPERPERLQAARSGLHAAAPEGVRMPIPARPVAPEETHRVHQHAYVSRLETALHEGRAQWDADTYLSPGSHEAAWAAAGGAIDLTRVLLSGDAHRGLALLRPPGHHARPDGAMGFCLLNNVALAAATALEQGAERVCILDWDVHHGNGTQDRFYDDPRVLFISLHQWPLYPGTGHPAQVGAGAARGRNINIALPAGSGSEAYGEAFRRLVLPVIDAFGADLTLVSAGFDGHARDPLAGLELEAATYAAMTTALLQQAERAGHGRVALFLEGGYDLSALESSVAAVTRALLGQDTDLPEDAPRHEERQALEASLTLMAPHWPDLAPIS